MFAQRPKRFVPLDQVDNLPPVLRELVWATGDLDCARRYLEMGIRTFEEAEEQVAREGARRLNERGESDPRHRETETSGKGKDVSIEIVTEKPADAYEPVPGAEPCYLCTAFRMINQEGKGFCGAKSPAAIYVGTVAARLVGQNEKLDVRGYWPPVNALTQRCRDDFERDPNKWLTKNPQPTTTDTGNA